MSWQRSFEEKERKEQQQNVFMTLTWRRKKEQQIHLDKVHMENERKEGISAKRLIKRTNVGRIRFMKKEPFEGNNKRRRKNKW